MVKKFKLSTRNFESFFNENYAELCRYCLKYVRDTTVAEELVQELFIHLWEKRKEITYSHTYKSYLIVATRNRALNYLNSQFARTSFDASFEKADHSSIHSPAQIAEGKELEEIINDAFQSLPPKCYAVFTMKKFARLTHREIAKELNISEKTVENHITTAIKKLRTFIESHYTHLSILVINLFS